MHITVSYGDTTAKKELELVVEILELQVRDAEVMPHSVAKYVADAHGIIDVCSQDC